MKNFKRFGFALFLVVILSLGLAACGESTATPAPTPRVVPSNTSSSGASTTSAAQPRTFSEKDTQSTLQLKVGETLLANFSPEMNWSFQLDPGTTANKPVLTSITQGVQEPYQAKFEAQNPGTVVINAAGSCKPEPGKLCHQAIITYDITITVS